MKQIYFSKLFLMFGFLIFIYIDAFAQAPPVTEVRPMTPNIAALFKLTDRPVGSFTGTVPVSFPLMTVSSGPLVVNLSLDYSTSGIRVEEVASSVGLGFSFNDGGGRIVQMVNSKRDDVEGLANPGVLIKPSNFDSSNANHLVNAYGNQLDLEPDIFTYSFDGKSGSFGFQEDGSIVNMNENGLKIEKYSNGFKITDADGSQYYFTTVSLNYYSYGPGTVYAPSAVQSSNWYLTEIKDINNENQIKFTYVSSGSSVFGFSSGYMILGNVICPEIGPPSPMSQSYVGTASTELVLAKVEGRSGYILCNSSDNRLDMASARKVNSLEYYDSTGTLKKKYKFNYSYSGAGSNSRLKLNNFSEFGANILDSLVYRFSYHSGSLPASNTKGVDFWGYSNGKVNNSSYFTDLVYTERGLSRGNLWSEVDRTPNPNYAMAESLTKITYPTGGYREFVYEGNTISQRVDFYEFIPDPDISNVQTFSITSFSGPGGSAPYAQKFFTVNSTYGGVYFKAIMSGTASNYNIRIFRANPGMTSGGTEIIGQPKVNVYKFDLPNGNYRLDVTSPSVSGVYATWSECTAAEGSYYNRKAGGIRIKEIRDYDPVSNKINRTKYLYKKYSSDSTITSGEVVSSLAFTDREYLRPSCSFRILNATGNYPMTSDGGSYVVYPEVRTIEDGNGWNDRVYKLAFDYNVGTNPRAPNTSVSSNRGQLLSEKIYNQSGTLLQRKVFGYNGFSNRSQIGLRVRVIFGIDNPNGQQKATFTPQIPSAPVPNTAWVTTWNIHHRKLAMSYSIDSSFNANGISVTKTNYTYEEINGSFLPKQVKTTTSNGATKEVNYQYASTSNAEFSFGLTASEQAMKTALFNKNYLQPLEITNTITLPGGASTLLGGRKMIFDTFNGSMLHPASVKEYTSSSDFRETFLSSYDDKGNVMEKYIDPSLREVYLWGYNGVYPVAKVIGNSLSNVLTGVNLSVLNSPLDDATLRTHLNAIRSNLATNLAQVETFTYNPGIGMTSSTDTKGMTTYYEYDNFGRLKHIKDQNGNIVKTYDYHYKP